MNDPPKPPTPQQRPTVSLGIKSGDQPVGLCDDITTAAPDRLRPMTSVGEEVATVVSELSFPDNASLFRGPLYPSPETIPETENEKEDTSSDDPDLRGDAKMALRNADVASVSITIARRGTQSTNEITNPSKAQIQEGVVAGDSAANGTFRCTESRSSGPNDRASKMPMAGGSNRRAKIHCNNDKGSLSATFEEAWRAEIPHFPSIVASQAEDSSQSQQTSPAPREHSLPGAFQRRPGWISSSSQVDEEAEDVSWDTSDPEISLQPDNSGLAEATPITLSSEMAEPVDANDVLAKGEPVDRRKRNAGLLLVILIAMIPILVGLITFLVGRNSSNMASSMDDISMNGTTFEAWSWDLNFTVPTSTLNAIEHGMTNGNLSATNPQFQAYRWMKADPYLANYSSERLQQRFALATFYYSTSGDNWKHRGGGTISIKDDKRGKLEFINVTSEEWLSYDHHECDWFSGAEVRRGKACESDNATLQSLVLVENELAGELPDKLFLLTSLEVIELGRNAIGGTIPAHVSKLTKLWKFWLGENNINGSLPSELGLLSNSLAWIGMVGNSLTGSLPSEIWQLSRLWRLNLGDNEMPGFLPSDIGMRATGLAVLRLNQAQFFGTLPTSMGLLEELERVALQNNQFHGSLPSELGLATSLTNLLAPYNQLSGTLPSELSQLEQLDIEGNINIVGTLPAEWAPMALLQIRGTSISGTIPEELCGTRVLDFECGPSLCAWMR